MLALLLVGACTLPGALGVTIERNGAPDGSLEGTSYQRPAVRERHIERVLSALDNAAATQDLRAKLEEAGIAVVQEWPEARAANVVETAPAAEVQASSPAADEARWETSGDAAGDDADAAPAAAMQSSQAEEDGSDEAAKRSDAAKRSKLMRREAAQTVDCKWDGWGEWFPCTKSCDGGYQSRWREFLTYPQGGGRQCDGGSHQLQNCNMHKCPASASMLAEKIDCQWGEWSDWGACSETCGGGSQEAVREIAVFPQNRGENCAGHSRMRQSCYPQIACPPSLVVNCEWHDWEEWEGCSAQCGDGHRASRRQVKMHPQNGGSECLGEVHRTEVCQGACLTQGCQWGPWTAWSTCSRTCGGGAQQAFRVLQESNGQDCQEAPWKEQECNVEACASQLVDCSWGEWQDWSDCSRTCGGGERKGMRDIAMFPQFGGADCTGGSVRAEPCAEAGCPDPRIDCAWGDWAVWTGCSSSCGGGTQMTTRMVTEYPQFGGANCEGDKTMVKLCNTHDCSTHRIDCEWGGWSEWSTCSKSCGTGTMEAFRNIGVYPQNGGLNCAGSVRQETECNLEECTAVVHDCEWGMWAFGPCSKTCGEGTQMGWREVIVHPQNGGKECQGNMLKWQSCEVQSCAASPSSSLEEQTQVGGTASVLQAGSKLSSWLDFKGSAHRPDGVAAAALPLVLSLMGAAAALAV